MMTDDLEKLRFPIGRFERVNAPLDAATRQSCLDTIEQLPAQLRALVAGRSDAALDTPYRPGGWTVRQVVHHLPDSHMNAYVRIKFAVTETDPPIRAYDEARWAELPEAKSAAVDMSLTLLDGLHRRWIAFLRALPHGDFAKAYMHPEMGRVTLDEAVALYCWHCRHHSAHITLGLNRS
jgi:hypothetical protein